MNQHQNNKNDGYDKMDIAPFVARHSPERFNLFSASPAVISPAEPACAGRQNETHNNAGENQAKQTYKTKQIDNEIQRNAFHKIPLKYEVLPYCDENFVNNKKLIK